MLLGSWFLVHIQKLLFHPLKMSLFTINIITVIIILFMNVVLLTEYKCKFDYTMVLYKFVKPNIIY